MSRRRPASLVDVLVSSSVDVYPHPLPFHRRLLADLLRMRYTFKRRSLMMLATPLPLGESILLLLSPFSFSPSFELTSVDDADDAAVDSVADADDSFSSFS